MCLCGELEARDVPFKDQILASILEICAPKSKTQIVYGSVLNLHTVMPYLELVIRNGLVMRIDGAVSRYKTTPN